MIFWFLLVGCTSAPTKQSSVLLLVVDGVRSDRVGLYGHNPSETPHMDALAKGGTKFSRAYAASTAAKPALLSMVLGLAPQTHGDRLHHHEAFDLAALKNQNGLLNALERDDVSWTWMDWNPYTDSFAGFKRTNATPTGTEFWIVRLSPLQIPNARDVRDLEYDSALHAYDAYIGQVLESWRTYRPDAHTIVAGVTGSLHGARDDAAVALTDDLLRVPLIVTGPGVEKEWEVVDVVSALDVSSTVATFLDTPFAGHGQYLITGGSDVAYHESTYAYGRFHARPVVGYTFKMGRYEESVFGRIYPASGNEVHPFALPISEHPAEAKRLRELQSSFGENRGLPPDAWDSSLDSSECVSLDTLSRKALRSLEKGRHRAAARMVDRIKEQRPDAPIVEVLESMYKKHLKGAVE